MKYIWKSAVALVGFGTNDKNILGNYFTVYLFVQDKKYQFWGKRSVQYEGLHHSLGFGKIALICWRLVI